jgi:hypothetical protein
MGIEFWEEFRGSVVLTFNVFGADFLCNFGASINPLLSVTWGMRLLPINIFVLLPTMFDPFLTPSLLYSCILSCW